MAKKRRSSQFKDSSQVIDIEEARRKRQEKRNKQKKQASAEEEGRNRSVRASIRAGRRKRKALYAVIIIAIIAAIGMSAANIISLVGAQREAQAEQDRLNKEKQQLEEQLKESEDPAYIEKAAREMLRMTDPNETIYVVEYGEEPDKEDKESE